MPMSASVRVGLRRLRGTRPPVLLGRWVHHAGDRGRQPSQEEPEADQPECATRAGGIEEPGNQENYTPDDRGPDAVGRIGPETLAHGLVSSLGRGLLCPRYLPLLSSLDPSSSAAMSPRICRD